MGAFSCMDCADREVGCHSKCEKYLKEKSEHDRIKAIKDKEQIITQYTGAWISKFKSESAKKAKFHPTYKNSGGR